MKKQFTSIGLDAKAEHIYRALLSVGDAPASIIAMRSGIKRTSVYHILENLIAMGLVSSYRENGVQRFVAEHPSRLKTFFERQAILAERMIPEFEKEITGRSLTPVVRFFEGKNAIRSMSEEALNTKEKLILSIGSTKKLLSFLGGKYGFGKRRRERGITQKAIRFPYDERMTSPCRILPEHFDFPGYVIMFDSSVGIIPFEEPARGIMITDRATASMMKSIFEVLWEFAKNKTAD